MRAWRKMLNRTEVLVAKDENVEDVAKEKNDADGRIYFT